MHQPNLLGNNGLINEPATSVCLTMGVRTTLDHCDIKYDKRVNLSCLAVNLLVLVLNGIS